MDIRERRLTQLAERCSAVGIPMTAQRRTVLDVLLGRLDHPTVDQIHSAVVARLPDVSKATVYRSLETLIELDLLRRVDHPGSSVRFDANTDPHHHFLCSRCGAIADLPLDSVQGYERLEYKSADTSEAEELAILVRGTCAACSDA
jgi:Fe2+ or Zn2+ uptake regulation protein